MSLYAPEFRAAAPSPLSGPLVLTEFLQSLWSLYHKVSFIQLIQRIFYMSETLQSSEDVVISKKEVGIKLTGDDYFVTILIVLHRRRQSSLGG